MKNILVVLALLSIVAPGLSGQALSSVNGLVTDPSGAVIAGAQITVTEVATGRAIPLTSNALGRYSVRNLIPGTYRIQVSAASVRGSRICSAL